MRRLCLLFLVLPLAACGSGSHHVSLAEAATKSANQTSSKMEMTMSTSTPGLSKPLTMTASGAFDNVHHRGQMNIDMSSFASSLGSGGSALTNPANWKGAEVVDASGGHVIVYMNLPFFTKIVPGHKPWIKLDLSAIGKGMSIDFSQLTSLSSNPAQMVDWLRATSGSITKEGTESIDGVQTTHYRAIVELSKYPDLVPPDRRAAMRKTIDSLMNLAHVRTIPVDVWFGSDNIVRKLKMNFTETIRGQSLGLDMSMHFHDFGVPVSVQLPPASQTVDLMQLARQGKTP